MTQMHLVAEADRTELHEDKTYDVAAIRIRAVDEHGNTLPFAGDPVLLETKGVIQRIGPAAIPLQGGMTGAYVRTTGREGTGTLRIYTASGFVQEISFHVTI